MFLPIPRLDDARWSDLVEEGRALIPLYAPDWTDHNVSDPGITQGDLFAWVTEMLIFRLDQVPDAHRRKFLALVGVAPAPPVAATTVVRFALPAGAAPVNAPAGVWCEARDGVDAPVRFRTLRDVHVLPARLRAVAATGAGPPRDLTGRLALGEPFAPFGDDPRPGAALELALDAALPVGERATLYATGAGSRSGAAERARLTADGALRSHHGARIVWELRAGAGRWRTLDPAAGEVADDTRALTLDGPVEIVPPEPMTADPAGRYQVRARFAGGAYDAAPRLRDVSLNAVAAEQAVEDAAEWPIAPRARILTAPTPGTTARLGIELDDHGAIWLLDAAQAGAPEVRVLDYRAPAGDAPGVLVAEARRIGASDGAPEQSFALPGAPAQASSVAVWTGHDGEWMRWTVRADLDASGPADAHVTVDAGAGLVRFGDGRRGQVPVRGGLVVAAYRTTRGAGGNLVAGAIDRLADDARTVAALDAAARAALEVCGPLPAAGGAAAETVEHAEGRAGELVAQPTRAVTLDDYERFALETPGTAVSRATALANHHPAFPCVTATGVITVVLVPHLPARRPSPSAGLRRAVAAHLDALRIVGTRVEVAAPEYVDVRIEATVRAQRLADPTAIGPRVVAALDAFLDPLAGGPDGSGWPFGRDVVRSEVLQVIDDVAGVDHVLALELAGAGGATCGNLCVPPLGLVVAGEHRIEVVRP